MTCCPHGFEIGKQRLPPGRAFAAPIGKCRCCGSGFPYMGSGMMTGGGNGRGSDPDTTLCAGCGARHRRWVMENGEVKITDPGTLLDNPQP